MPVEAVEASLVGRGTPSSTRLDDRAPSTPTPPKRSPTARAVRRCSTQSSLSRSRSPSRNRARRARRARPLPRSGTSRPASWSTALTSGRWRWSCPAIWHTNSLPSEYILTISSWPRAIVALDLPGAFTSCATGQHPVRHRAAPGQTSSTWHQKPLAPDGTLQRRASSPDPHANNSFARASEVGKLYRTSAGRVLARVKQAVAMGLAELPRG